MSASSTAGMLIVSRSDGGRNVRPTRRRSKGRTCCFCWCCCCSCSWWENLQLKTPSEESTQPLTANQNRATDGYAKEKISLEDVKSWSETFDRLMHSATGRNMFREFLRSEYSEENILFWLACEDLKTETNIDSIEEKARMIYEDFISILSPKEVSLDSRVRELINHNMMEPTRHTFDEAQIQIYTLMHRDSYPRFLNSPMYKNLLAGHGLHT